MSKIRILECIRQGQIGGGESHLLSLVENLDRSRFEPVVLSFTEGPMIDRLQQMQVPVHVIPTLKPFDFTKWGSVKKLMQQYRIDLVHAHGTRANSNVLWAARSLGIPVVYTVHGWSFHPDQKPLVRNIRILGERYLTTKSDLNISVSASNQLSGKKFMSGFSSEVINNGIDLRKFNPDGPHRDIRSELGIPAKDLLVLFIARFTAHKQPLSLIRAFAKALSYKEDMHLLMVGDGDEKEQAVKLIAELGLSRKITLSPFRQDVPDVLASADIFVLPSLWEGLPIGLLEAMAMGKAVIASKVDGTCEIVEHNHNGMLIETDTLVDSLSEAIVELGKDREKRESLRKAARQRISEQFNAAAMTRKIEAVYERLLHRQRESAGKRALQV